MLYSLALRRGLTTAIALAALATSYADGFEWQTSSPEEEQMSSARLDALVSVLADHRTEDLLVIRHDRIVCQWHSRGHGRHVLHYTASLAKALVGGVALMVAINDGRLSPDDLACKYVPQWRRDPLKSRITIRHLATHTSGLEDAKEGDVPHDKLPGWKGRFWRRKENPLVIARDETPVLFEPGTRLAYSNPGMAMLGYCLTVALKNAPEKDLRTLLDKRIMSPLGLKRSEWSMSYGKTFEADGLPLQAVWGGGAYSPEAVARVGRLMLRRGNWQGRQLVRPEVVDLMVADAGAPEAGVEGPYPAAGLAWWLNSRRAFKLLPRDAFLGAGAGHQILLVVPSLDLVVVRMGQRLGPGSMSEGDYWRELEEYLINPLMTAFEAPLVPPSPVLGEVTFAPRREIRRAAVGSDNWPLTWADDDVLYAAYGDGRGFEPGTDRKLSLGLARIVGGPQDFRGVNLRSPTAERVGDGRKGAKASGMLMVDGVLYMLVRNVGNSQLAWSEDHGATWQWGFNFTTSFGCPTFLNFGRDYQGARDDYVYVYSNDGPTAYESSSAVVLARVRREHLRDPSAYEFFVRLDGGRPVWSKDIADCRPVLAYPGHCSRCEVVYDAGLRRYLMALGFDHAGGWGLFDAPEPWGPWTVAYWTKDWGLGGTHSYRLPTKWISRGGRTLWMVFSGREHEGVNYDAFCVRRMSLHLRRGVSKTR
ncbi:MAG: serine hydrolase [Armatimonadetes bacterium]|nr:serine hydrolase [Armatimonadota bacterium]